MIEILGKRRVCLDRYFRQTKLFFRQKKKARGALSVTLTSCKRVRIVAILYYRINLLNLN